MERINYQKTLNVFARFRELFLTKYDKVLSKYKKSLEDSLVYGDTIDEELRSEYHTLKEMKELIFQLEFEFRKLEMINILDSIDELFPEEEKENNKKTLDL